MQRNHQFALLLVGVSVLLGAWAIQSPDYEDRYSHCLFEPGGDVSEDAYYQYQTLSEDGRQAIENALNDSNNCWVAQNVSETAPEFDYVTDNFQYGSGIYFIEYRNETFELHTSVRGGGSGGLYPYYRFWGAILGLALLFAAMVGYLTTDR